MTAMSTRNEETRNDDKREKKEERKERKIQGERSCAGERDGDAAVPPLAYVIRP